LLARRLWPDLPLAAVLAPWLLFGCLFWAGFSTLVQFDLLLVFCTLLGMFGMLRAARGLGSGWLMVGAAVGLGMLAKGQVVLLPLLSVALLGHFWVERARLMGWMCWYGGLFSALLLGALIGLAWALPAAQAGGAEYRQAILWGQVAERLVDSFAHRRPVWWYLPWLPVLLLPWSLWPPLWRALRRLWQERQADRGLRFVFAWFVPVLLVLSLVSGKQVKYLLPIFPALALLGAYALARAADVRLPRRQWLAGSLLAAPILLFVAAGRHGLGAPPHWVDALQPAWGEAFLVAAVLWWLWRPVGLENAVAALALAGLVLLGGLHIAVLRAAAPAYDLRAISERLAQLQAEQRPIAHVGKYHSQFHFLGRLREPLEAITPPEALDWARAHPDGYLVVYFDIWPGPREGAEYIQDYRGDPADLALWSAEKLLAVR
jgi:4-amino-4-deoxy-L-arabinose transferase-like glycosyltransferase